MAGADAQKYRVLIVDDHPIFRQGLGRLIDAEPDLCLCGEAESASQALRIAAQCRPDIAVVDITLKGRDGMELAKDFSKRFPNVPVLMLSMHDETLYAERALRAGARGYIMKQESTDQVLLAIRRLLAGGVYVSQHMATKILGHIAGHQVPSVSPLRRLSDRELQVFRLLGTGRGTREIAAELHLGVTTIESHRANIKRKLELHTAAELMQHAVRWAESD